MAGRSPEHRVFVPKGEEVRVVLEGGTILDIRNPGAASYTVEHRTPSEREKQREELKARYPDILFPHVRSRLQQHGYRVLGGEEMGTEMALIETEAELKAWMTRAKAAGISNLEILGDTKALLGNVTIGSPRSGEISPLIQGIRTEIEGFVNETWGVKRPARGQR